MLCVDFVQKSGEGGFCMWNHVISKLHISGSLSRKSCKPLTFSWWSHICIWYLYLEDDFLSQDEGDHHHLIEKLLPPPHPDFCWSWKVPKSWNQFAGVRSMIWRKIAPICGDQWETITVLNSFYYCANLLWFKVKARTGERVQIIWSRGLWKVMGSKPCLAWAKFLWAKHWGLCRPPGSHLLSTATPCFANRNTLGIQ